MYLVVLALLVYIVTGTVTAIKLRWQDGQHGEVGIDLLLDVVFWPFVIFYWSTRS